MINFIRFMVPSFVGFLLFLYPIHDEAGNLTIAISLIVRAISAFLGEAQLLLLVIFCVVTAVLNVVYTYWHRRPAVFPDTPLFRSVFNTSPMWFWLRLLGAVFALMYYFQWGPEFLIREEAAGVAFRGVGTAMMLTFTVACVLLPFLTDFGLMEFVGTLISPLFRKLFRLPGQAAIDGLASIAAAAGIGVLITISQYRNGFYSLREASVVATNFSMCSIPFSVIVANTAGVDNYFPWFLTGVGICFFCVLIMPRIPPLSRIPDSYSPAGKQLHEEAGEGRGVFIRAYRAAMTRAAAQPGPEDFLKTAGTAVMEVSFGIISAAMAVIVISMVVVNDTPVLDILSYPFVPVMEFFGLPEARDAAPGFLVGFLEVLLPAVIAQNISSELTSFVLAGMALTQLIFMSEMGILILRSELPLNFMDLFVIFLIRTMITLPLWVGAAHFLVV